MKFDINVTKGSIFSKDGLTTTTKTVQIGGEGKEKRFCPSCGERMKDGVVRCEICGAAYDGAATVSTHNSRLSDEELSAKLSASGKKSAIATYIWLPALILTIIFFCFSNWYGVIPCGIVTAVLFFYSSSANAKMTKLVKVNIVRDALAEVFEVEEYKQDGRLETQLVKDTHLISNWNECHGNDFVRGKYRGIPFVFSDLELDSVSRSTDSEGNDSESRQNVFRGQWLAFQIQKNIEVPLYVRERDKKERKRLFGKSADEQRGIETENAAFNAQFHIQTDNPHTAFYILTPHFMEYIVQSDVVAGAHTNLFFGNNWVHVAVHNGHNSFELGKDAESGNVPALRARIKSEVRYITSVVDELLKNEYLFGAGAQSN